MLNDFKILLSLTLLIPLVSIIGLYLSFKLRFVQITKIFEAFKLFAHDRGISGKANSFSAVSAVLGGNLGTGNIAGIAVALTTGGPGALFWMWIMAFLGATLKFVGCTLAILYRKRDDVGENVGGPMYYLEKGLGMPILAKLFCVFTILSALTVGNLVQMHSLALPLTKAGIPPLLTGIVMSILIGCVIWGGLKRFVVVVSAVVPVMALAYILACLGIIVLYLPQVPEAVGLIIHSAFHPGPVIGGIAGYGVLEAIRVGFDRGLFATDVGAGLAPILHSSVESDTSEVKTALAQGMISMISPLVVMVVCTMTGLVLILTGAWQHAGLESTNLCIHAFSVGFGAQWAGHIVTITLCFFAFTTILTWSFCADKAVEYLFSVKYIHAFQILFILCIPLGTFLHVHLVWSVADIFMNFMLLINLIGLISLAPQVIKITQGREF